jgi:murein hydrolase activator
MISSLRLMTARLPIAVLLLFFPLYQGLAGDISQRLQQVQQERTELKQVREGLETRLDQLGQELKQVDTSLVQASSEARQAQADVRAADTRIASLNEQQSALLGRINRLKGQMQREASLAYRQIDKSALWISMLLNAQVAEIPHRQYLLSRLVQRQQQNRLEYAKASQQLAVTQNELEQQRKSLDALLIKKEQRQKDLQAALAGKRALWEKVRLDAKLKAARDAELARQEDALQKLLKGMGSTLLKTDNIDDWKSMRQLKGKLPWPMVGRIVANFHSPTAPGRPSLAGILLAPRNGDRQVKAIAAGQVRFADWFGGYGLMMIVDHGDGLMTVYAHNNALYKRPGDWVAEGDVLADAGNTGWVQDTRLYFEVRDSGRPSNPRHWCRNKG